MAHVDAFEEDKAAVLDDLRKGHFDHVEVTSRVTEARFFRYLLEQGDLKRLAASYPTPREKEEVPLWLYLASQLTLRLHGQHAYATLPYVLHCGGLRDALGPGQVRLTEAEGRRRLRCEGYNEKNVYERTTPCDQDTVRKLAKDTSPSALVTWYGEHVARYLHGMGGFDEDGIFLVDGSYLFVPDNEHYEGSSKLRFDAHGHPLARKEFEALSPAEKDRTRWRRCYRSVFLLHLGKDSYPFAGLRVLAGKGAEQPQLRHLVDGFVGGVGRGVMKMVIVDRGFIDGATISHLKQEHGVDTLVPLKKGMLDLADAQVLAKADGEPWEVWRPPTPEAPPEPAERPAVIRKREAKRRETLEQRKRTREAPPPPVLEKVELKAIRDMGLWETLDVPIQVVLMREHWSDGTVNEWSLATTNQALTPLEVRDRYHARTSIEERHRHLKCFWDLTAFRSRAFSMVTAQVTFVLLAYSLLQVFLAKLERGDLNDMAREHLLGELGYEDDKVVLYSRNRVAYLTPLEHQKELLTLNEGARRRVLARTEQLQERMVPGAGQHPQRPGT